MLDTEKLAWVNLGSFVRGVAPDARDSFGVAAMNDKLFVFGGYAGIGERHC